MKQKLSQISKINANSITKEDKKRFLSYLDTANLVDNKIINFQRNYWENLPKSATRKVTEKTILYSKVRPVQMHNGIFTDLDFDNIVVSNAFFTVDVDESIADPHFIYYYLTDRKQISKMQILAESSTTYPTLSLENIENFEIELPNINVQVHIGKLLSSIDKKINLNNKINDNLEKQMKLIYKYWFDDFNFIDKSKKPYKANGGAMIWNEELKKEIPKGWTIKTLSELLVKNKDKFDFSSILPTIDLSVMVPNKMTISQHNWSSEFSSNLFKMEQGDILFGSIRPYLHKAGFAPFDGVVAGTVHSFKPINNNYYNFSLITICRDVFFDYAVQMSYGTRMPVVNDVALLNYKIPYNEDVIKDFNKINILKIMSKLINENIKLINLKNQLLPLLMNGQVTIED
ncbi:restriction endonuclease subunit S [Mycoplasmopsis bovis]|uniref:restriction endonuclease subunit S n=4 Tax=Mycoplasmopsis bovis TaxID=28903 RepID=UPI00244ED1CD|nr:restriction endonuclease subunit S [Mycoplasmopsis bovis]